MPRARVVAIVQTLLVIFSGALGTVLMKRSFADVDPLTFTWLSVAVGMVVLGGYTFIIRGERVPRGLGRQVWLLIIAIGLCNFVISKLSRPFALDRLPATTTTFLGNFIGFVTMGMSIFILKESPTIFQILGAVVAFAGLRVFFNEVPSGYELVGVLLILIGLVAVAYTNNIARKLAMVTNNELSNNIVSSLALLIGGSITVAIGLLLDWPPQVGGWQNWASILYVGVITVGIGLTVWNNILRTLRSYEASILGASSVIWTVLLAVPILGERLTGNQIAGIVLMFVGLALVQIRRGQLSTLFRRPATQSVNEVPPASESVGEAMVK